MSQSVSQCLSCLVKYVKFNPRIGSVSMEICEQGINETGSLQMRLFQNYSLSQKYKLHSLFNTPQ